MRNLSNEEISSIIHKYTVEKQACSKISKEFRLQFNDIKVILENNNITPRTHRESRKKYEYNENYFNSIDTPEQAYWLGFIYADGFITKRTNGNSVFGITLAELEPLEKLNSCMQSTKPIYMYNKRNGFKPNSLEYKLSFTSNQLVNDLEKLGCIERKTFQLKFPSFLNKKLIPHFIRGYFDGDGSVFYHILKANNTEYIQLGVTICGIESFLKDLIKHIDVQGIESCIYKDKRKQTDCYSLKLPSNIRCLQLYHYMYKDANTFLSRKKDKFENFIKDRGSTTTISNPIYGNTEYKKLCYIED